MNKTWMLSILALSLILLAILKTHELNALRPYFKSERVLKLERFEKARSRVDKSKLEQVKLWESILTGRSAPLPRLLKERYQALGLSHLFTPSGFHLSAVLSPLMKIVKSKYHLLLFCILGAGLFFIPGLMALKRMLIVKSHQKVMGQNLGFAIAMVMDIFFGSFQSSPLSFTYSFLFLGIIYSGVEGLGLIVWFFIGQIILCYFQNSDIPILILFFSPILNLGFGIIMPILFCFSFPLWDWQLHIGIFLLQVLQYFVDLFSSLSIAIPAIEVHAVLLVLMSFVLFRKWKSALILFVFLSSSLNLDRERTPGVASNEFVPTGKWLKTTYQVKQVKVDFEDGSCRMRLIRGYWWENCSPRYRRSRSKKIS